jgi:GT2 family glycosyltransferase
MVDLSVIILSWNTKEDLQRCLASVETSLMGRERAAVGAGASRPGPGALDAGGENSVEVIVVDNDSSDGSPQMVREQYPWVDLIESGKNLGFAGGNNLALRRAKGRHLLLLNPDTIVHGDALMALVRFAGRTPDAGIVGSKLLNRDGSLQPSCRRFPTLANGFFRETPLGKLFPNNKYNREYLMSDFDHSKPSVVDWVTGASLLIRRECYEQLGDWDENFFMYCEDVDYCYRAYRAGWKVYYCPDSVITHLGGQSSDKAVTAMLVARHQSMFYFFRKHYAATSNPLIWPVVVAGLTGRAGMLIVKNRIDRWREARAKRRAERKANS